ncbi:hypothetical protein Ddc_16679 [Ditylenchus destructor]|nr:hypothetical protein Ddc_16679 [Ditylenchus destructor]
MLAFIWLLLSALLALGQLIVIAQTDCLTVLVLAGFLVANLILWISLAMALAAVFRTACRKEELGMCSAVRLLDMAAKLQFFSGLLTGLILAVMPFDMREIYCSANELLKSIANCRIGWAYAIACVLCLIGLCLPVVGKFVADKRKSIYYVVMSGGPRQHSQV